jgi:phosphopantothenoylcysteine decarboxylase/phosphopantothenate--cysteine ligase
MAEPEDIFARCRVLLGDAGPLRSRRVLVSAGGTREPLDSVRFLGNRSSGRMGVALAEEARRRGADVTLLAANLAVAAPAGVEVVPVLTAEEMAREALSRRADVVVMAAAVADYRPAERVEGKRPKDDRPWRLVLEPTLDIVRALAERRSNGTLLVAFGADEGEQGLGRKRLMLEAKKADLVVFNDVSQPGIGFDSDENEVVLVSRSGERHVPRAPKRVIAAAILDEVERLLEGVDAA